MSEQVRIKPAGANLVRNPDQNNRHLASEGEPVVLNGYWRRRIKDGDVVLVSATTAVQAKENK